MDAHHPTTDPMPLAARCVRWTVGAAIALCSAACAVAPAPAPQRAATPINASAGKTWDAVVDIFAERNIPIRNMERASGFIATEPMDVGLQDGEKWADCGGDIAVRFGATRAAYNVLVRGDSTNATVRVTVLWSRPNATNGCTTRGVWEPEFEALVKSRAEGTAKGA